MLLLARLMSPEPRHEPPHIFTDEVDGPVAMIDEMTSPDGSNGPGFGVVPSGGIDAIGPGLGKIGCRHQLADADEPPENRLR